MAYADIQNKVGQIQMANRILLAQKMDPNKTPETDLSGFQEQGGYIDQETIDELQKVDKEKKLDRRTIFNRKKKAQEQLKTDEQKKRQETKEEMEEFYKGPSDKTIRERQAAIDRIKGRLYGGPVEDAKRQDDMKRGDYLEDPENPHLNNLLKIGGAAAGFGGNLLRMLINPLGGNALASTPQDGRAPTRLFYNAPYDKPEIFIKDKQTIEDAKERFKWNTGIDLAGKGFGYQVTPTGYIVAPNGKAYYNEGGKLIYEGTYDEAIHGELIPPTEQANQSMQINPLMANFPYEFEGGVITPRYFSPPRYRNKPYLHMRTKDITDEELFHFNNFIKSMGGGLDTVRRQTPLSIG